MRYYLSSFKLGDEPSEYFSLLDRRKSVGYISNALDHVVGKDEWLESHIADDVQSLEALKLSVKIIDLKEYFGQASKLLEELSSLSGLWVSGGNVFVLRQALMLSGLDEIICTNKLDSGFVYGGYSAACCVLSSSLKPYQEASDASITPYGEVRDTIWSGLGIIDFAFMPHYKSNHSETEKINTEIDYCIKHSIPYKAFSDGSILVL